MVKIQSPFGLFWSVKYLNFEEKLQIRAAHHTFIESRHPEVTKNPYYAFFPKGRQKKVSSHGLIAVCRSVYIHYFKTNAPIFCCPLFSENYRNPQVIINKMVNKHTVDYHHSPSQLISRTLSYFYGLLKGLSLQNLSRNFS